MPTLWKALGRRFKVGIVVAGLLALVAWDLRRPPDAQLSAAGYMAAVKVYQGVGRPIVRRFVVCRYTPSCSDYSLQAVAKHGFIRGLRLTVSRVLSCTGKVPLGTVDPVPNAV